MLIELAYLRRELTDDELATVSAARLRCGRSERTQSQAD